MTKTSSVFQVACFLAILLLNLACRGGLHANEAVIRDRLEAQTPLGSEEEQVRDFLSSAGIDIKSQSLVSEFTSLKLADVESDGLLIQIYLGKYKEFGFRSDVEAYYYFPPGGALAKIFVIKTHDML